MRKILISLCVLIAALSIKAQTISGIRVDGGDTPILVYMGGYQICSPTASCFIANLRGGYYTIEVYASRHTRAGERVWKGQLLYNKRIYFKGTGVEEIYVGGNNTGNRPVRPNANAGSPQNDNVMSSRLFESFYQTVAGEKTAADRLKVISSAVDTSEFTCEQCLRITGLFTFDNDKMIVMRKMYPGIVDKQAFFKLIGTLKFSESKDKMNAFVKDYNASAL